MAEMIARSCPYCGKELQVPSDLEEFSCLYCGERIKLEKEEILPPLEDLEGTVADLRVRLLGAVTRYPDMYKKLGKKDFFVTFENYENDNRRLLKEVDLLIRRHPEGESCAAEQLCQNLMDDLDQHMEGDKRWARKSQRSNVIFEIKVVLAIFLTPLVRKMKLKTAELFRDTLHRCWMERHPKDEWTPGDYDILVSGYKKRKWCYITTATCLHEGKSDRCPELQSFRAFRDGWLTQQGGEALIAEYYEKAPAIVACIELCDNADACYSRIRETWLKDCYEALQQGRYAYCLDRYTQMVQALERRYLRH